MHILQCLSDHIYVYKSPSGIQFPGKIIDDNNTRYFVTTHCKYLYDRFNDELTNDDLRPHTHHLSADAFFPYIPSKQ